MNERTNDPTIGRTDGQTNERKKNNYNKQTHTHTHTQIKNK